MSAPLSGNDRGPHGSNAPRTYGPTEALLFSDGLGDRVVSADATTGELVQILRINPALTAVPSFEFALRERVARLANFRHQYYARIRRVDRVPSHGPALALVSDHVEGTRLSEILRVAEERRLHLDTNAALCLVRQLVPALAVLHENARDAAHGILAPERLIVTPQGRLVVAEHVFGAAVEQMQYGRERLWHELRVAMPPSAGIPRFDQRADVTAIGVTTLSLVLGRPLREDEFPRALGDLLSEARERTALGDEAPLSADLRWWLGCALHLDMRRAFVSAAEALAALDQVTAENPAYVPAPVALETFLSRYIAAILVPSSPPERAAPAPTVVQPAHTADDERSSVDLSELLNDSSPEALFNAAEPFSLPAPAASEDPLPNPVQPKRSRRAWLAAAAAAIVVAAGGFAAFRTLAVAPPPALATLSVDSNPAGVPVFVDGVERGVTPVRLTLAAGPHILELRRGVPRVIPLALTSGAEVSQYLEFLEAPLAPDALLPPAPEPPPAAPAQPPPPAGAPLAGWITARAPFAVEIRQHDRLIGTTEADRVMLAAGTHDLEFVNQSLGYRATRSVQVTAGRVTTITLDLPKGTVNLNATPWAEVWINGARVGETPIGNLALPIGPHEIVFRHPQFGEKRHAISVTTGVPVRVSVDMK
ncbi:MAG TPA: PEGA domain-containing protein [Vicinamibacterales bacterium]|nr:PEGA domain-containing protein [Vicinamibacterales bacterium]